jgi:hypothetical protein
MLKKQLTFMFPVETSELAMVYVKFTVPPLAALRAIEDRSAP